MVSRTDETPVSLEPHPADNRLALLRFGRPPVNAFDQRMWDLFDQVAATLHGDTLYRAVVIAGQGEHFAAGADVRELIGLTPERFAARNRAKELILTGRTVTADEALAIGLADRVLDDACVLDEAVAEGLRFARGPLALRYAKQSVDAALGLAVEDGLALEADLIARCFASEDGQRGLRSFVDQGPGKAAFRGR